MPMTLTGAEQEVIVLRAIWDLIDSAVNHEMLTLGGQDPEAMVRFKSSTHQKFFNIVLVDLLSQTDSKAPIPKKPYLEALLCITLAPQLGSTEDIAHLEESTVDFIDWLNRIVDIEIWLPTIDVGCTIKVKRSTFIKMTGNITKHNFLRTYRVAQELQSILKSAGVTVNADQACLALSDFYEKFNYDVLEYHSSTLAELMNNVRWGIFYYLQSEFKRSYRTDSGSESYSYTFPKNINSAFARGVYWDLMNCVRTPPYFRKFVVSRWLKIRDV